MMTTTNRRLIDITERELQEIISECVSRALASSERASNIISGRANIAKALGIGVDKLDSMVKEGALGDAVKKNGRTMICDINKAFDAFNDEYN